MLSKTKFSGKTLRHVAKLLYNDHFDALTDDVLGLISFLEQSPTDVH